jgi:hypothetical protein
MPTLTAGDLEKRNQARMLYAYVIMNNKDVSAGSTIRKQDLLASDVVLKDTGALFTTYAEEQALTKFILQILSGSSSATGSTSGLTQISFTAITDAGSTTISDALDDANVPIPMSNIVFNFFGTNYSSNLFWNSNNAIIFGVITFQNLSLSNNISATTMPSILFGNYDRVVRSIYYSNSIRSGYSITTLLITFVDFFNNVSSDSTYTYQIRLIKETVDSQRQFIEVSVISSPPSPGYSSAAITYPTGVNVSGQPQDTNGNTIDQTKNSPYNITNGTAFLNPCGSTFSTASPPAGTSFVFSSDSTGTNWLFTNNSHINV